MWSFTGGRIADVDAMRFNGPDYVRSLDDVRLGQQYTTIFDLMKDGKWRSLSEIETVTGYPAASISAQLRHMRKERFGSHTVNKHRTGDPKSGLFEYQLVLNGSVQMPQPISIFKGQYSFLSNFFIEPDGTHVEREYQVAKCTDDVQRRVFDTLTPAQCKKYGRKVSLRPDWEQVKLQIMEDLVMAKFVDHNNLRELLLATGDAELSEGNHWHDIFWGRCSCPVHHGEGENHLGLTLMGVREWIK